MEDDNFKLLGWAVGILIVGILFVKISGIDSGSNQAKEIIHAACINKTSMVAALEEAVSFDTDYRDELESAYLMQNMNDRTWISLPRDPDNLIGFNFNGYYQPNPEWQVAKSKLLALCASVN